jgi:putative acetyltransferase
MRILPLRCTIRLRLPPTRIGSTPRWSTVSVEGPVIDASPWPATEDRQSGWSTLQRDMGVPRRPEVIGATSIQVRPESPTDVPAVDELIGRAFDGRPNEVELVQRLREADSPTVSRVATIGDKIVGHVMYSQLGLEGSTSTVLTLAPVSVEPDYQNRGVGTRVISVSLAELDDAGVPSVVVLGEPSYYSRFGFEPVSRYGITAPTGVPMAHLMILPLSHSDASLVGRLVYPDAFTETGTI